MPSETLSSLESKGYGYDPLSGQVSGSADSTKYVRNPKTGNYDSQG